MVARQKDSLISQALPRALFVFLKILFYFVVLPYKVWKASIIRLADISNKPLLRDEEEFPVYTIFKIAYDAVITILPILGIIFMFGYFLGFYYGYNSFIYSISSIFYPINYIFSILGNFFYYDLNNFLYFGNFFYYLSSGIPIFLVYYFMIPFISLFKEILTFPLSLVHNLEKIDKNTKD